MRVRRHRVVFHWGALSFLWPFVVMGWFLAGCALSSVDDGWLLLTVWLVPLGLEVARWLVAAMVGLGAIEARPRRWSRAELEERERELDL